MSVSKGGKKNPRLRLPTEVFVPTAPAVAAPPRDLDSKACVTIGDKNFVVKADDLEQIEELGRGAYGVVDKMRHVPSGVIMAVKRIRATVNTLEQKRLLMDLDISMRTVDCFFTVTFYGALFREGDVWICMELMDTSLDKSTRRVIEKGMTIPEDILGKITVAIVKALEHLHNNLSVIHRDVKPSNVLINTQGQVKMCDFGISGHLVELGPPRRWTPAVVTPVPTSEPLSTRAGREAICRADSVTEGRRNAALEQRQSPAAYIKHLLWTPALAEPGGVRGPGTWPGSQGTRGPPPAPAPRGQEDHRLPRLPGDKRTTACPGSQGPRGPPPAPDTRGQEDHRLPLIPGDKRTTACPRYQGPRGPPIPSSCG
ncbi:unnamed protein product [Arctogadus glacialis]